MGGAASANAGSGGASGAGGAGGKAAGGSGGLSSSAVRGAVSINVLAPTECSVPAQYVDFPKLAAGHPIGAVDKSMVLEHGGTTPEGQAVTITCTWLDAASPPGFDAVLTIGAGAARRRVNLGAASLVAGQASTGGLVVPSSELAEQYGAPLSTCIHTPIEVDLATRSVWGLVTCPEFETTDGSSVCEVGPSYYYFENCTPR